MVLPAINLLHLVLADQYDQVEYTKNDDGTCFLQNLPINLRVENKVLSTVKFDLIRLNQLAQKQKV